MTAKNRIPRMRVVPAVQQPHSAGLESSTDGEPVAPAVLPHSDGEEEAAEAEPAAPGVEAHNHVAEPIMRRFGRHFSRLAD